jgi:Fic family protein
MSRAWAVGWEELPWRSEDSMSMPQRHRRRITGSYRAAVPASIAELELALPSWVGAESAEAAVAVAQFDADASHVLPSGTDNNAPELAPLLAVLLRTESAASSQIENVTAGARALALATIGQRTGLSALMVAENVAAMQAAMGLAERIDKPALLAMHTALMKGTHPDIAGEFRREQVWIGGSDFGPHQAMFVPPDCRRVNDALDDLIRFCDRDDIPPLSQAALAHAQFETIHPFVDGNGRVGRALVHAMLRRARVTRRMTVPVSAGLLTDTDAYFEALTAYRSGDLVPIVERFAHAAHRAVSNGNMLIAELVGVRARWENRILARRHAAVWRALDLLIRQPAVTVAVVQEDLGVSQPTAQGAIDELVRAEILIRQNEFRRNRVWICPDVLGALDAFAHRAGRRPLAADQR